MTDPIDTSPEAVAQMLDGVTPGPWQLNGSHAYGPDPHRELVAQVFTRGASDLLFIAWAREAVPALAARVAELEADIAYTRHTDTMNDIVLMGLARDAAEADLATARNAALEELQGAVQLLRRQAGGNADGIRFQALDDVRQMIRKRLDTLKEPTP